MEALWWAKEGEVGQGHGCGIRRKEEKSHRGSRSVGEKGCFTALDMNINLVLLPNEAVPCVCFLSFLFFFFLTDNTDLKTEKYNSVPSFIFYSLALLPAAWRLAHLQQALSDADFSLNR